MKHCLIALSLVLVLSSLPAQADTDPPKTKVAEIVGVPSPMEEIDGGPTEEAPKKAPAAAKKTEKVAPQRAPENVGEAMQDVGILIEAANSGNWPLFAGVLVMLLVFLLDKLVKLKKRVPKSALPWVAAVLGVTTTMGAALTTGIPIGQALIQGFTAGATAVGLWELIFKHWLKKKKAKA